jgi:CHAT domain-containing protein
MTVGDIMNLRTAPYLVTLSACDTGLARISGGDELLGLVRGFFVAGSPSLLTTLWEIDDESTALLVSRFYENLITRGMNKAEALREAKLHLKSAGYERPFYWAGFVVQGDWR